MSTKQESQITPQDQLPPFSGGRGGQSSMAGLYRYLTENAADFDDFISEDEDDDESQDELPVETDGETADDDKDGVV